MSLWLLNRLFEHQNQPTPRFAFQGTVNWMRALAILVDETLFDNKKLKNHYSHIQRRPPNLEADTLAYHALLMSLHNAASLKTLSSSEIQHYNIVKISIISWYYAIYYACKSMIAASSGSDPQTHAKTSKVWQKDIVDNNLPFGPFKYSLKDLTPSSVDANIAILRGQNKHDLSKYPIDEETAYGAIFSYLKGTADYEKDRIEERVRNDKEFKALGCTNFRTKTSRKLRDRSLSCEHINFLIQAFRYRGKANYRDSIYLSYGENRSESVSKFICDLELVASKFVTMSCHYVSRRTENGTWQSFVDDMRDNARFSLVVDLEQI